MPTSKLERFYPYIVGIHVFCLRVTFVNKRSVYSNCLTYKCSWAGLAHESMMQLVDLEHVWSALAFMLCTTTFSSSIAACTIVVLQPTLQPCTLMMKLKYELPLKVQVKIRLHNSTVSRSKTNQPIDFYPRFITPVLLTHIHTHTHSLVQNWALPT